MTPAAGRTEGCSNIRSARSLVFKRNNEYLLLVQVLDKIGLALELPLDLLGHHRVK